MEELGLGRNMRGAWSSDPARLLLLLFLHLVQRLEERVSFIVIQPSAYVNPPAVLYLLNVEELLWCSVLYPLTMCRSSSKAGSAAWQG